MIQSRRLYISTPVWLNPLLCLHSVKMNMNFAIKYFPNQTLQLIVSQTYKYWQLYFAIWTNLNEYTIYMCNIQSVYNSQDGDT